MKAEIISIGTELLLGQIENSDASYLASQLPLLGLDLYWISVVGDNRERMTEVLKRAWDRSDVIITTGGLGPTRGDLTREVIASFLGEKLEVAPDLLERVRSFFVSRGIEMSPNNMKQAMLIPSARPVFNPLGTAPGWWVERDNRIIVALPGPPHELQLMWEKEVVPRLQARMGDVIHSRIIKTFGLGESRVDEVLGHLLGAANPTLATYAKMDGVQIRVTAKARDIATARDMVARVECDVRQLLDDYVWGVDSDVVEEVVGRQLLAGGRSLATMESYTCGTLAAMLSAVPGSSRYFRGGIVINSNQAKTAFDVHVNDMTCEVESSSSAAEDMAAAVRKKLSSDVGLAIAGATECGDKNADNVYIAIDDGRSRRSIARNYPSYLRLAKQRAAHAALFELRRFLI